MWFTNVLNKPLLNIYSSREGTIMCLLVHWNKIGRPTQQRYSTKYRTRIHIQTQRRYRTKYEADPPSPSSTRRRRMTKRLFRRVARNSQSGGVILGFWGGAPSRRKPMGVWGRSHQPLEAGGLGAKPPAARNMGFWGRSPSAQKFFAFCCKNNLILGIFW